MLDTISKDHFREWQLSNPAMWYVALSRFQIHIIGEAPYHHQLNSFQRCMHPPLCLNLTCWVPQARTTPGNDNYPTLPRGMSAVTSACYISRSAYVSDAPEQSYVAIPISCLFKPCVITSALFNSNLYEAEPPPVDAGRTLIARSLVHANPNFDPLDCPWL